MILIYRWLARVTLSAPNVTLSAPNLTLSAPNVTLSGVEGWAC